jgi:hypothetical protein
MPVVYVVRVQKHAKETGDRSPSPAMSGFRKGCGIRPKQRPEENTARYCGTRKNLYDLRRAASIQNLEIAQRMAS